MLGGKRHIVPLASDTFATLLPAALSVPLALVFGLAIPLVVLGIQADPSAYVIGIIGLGLLTSLDIRKGFQRALEGFGVTLLASFYVIDHSLVGQSLLPLSSGEWSFLLVSLPPSLGVLLAGILFSNPSKYKIIKSYLVGSIGLAIGIGLGVMLKADVEPSADSAVFTLLYYVGLSIPANIVQMALFYLLDRSWKTKHFSLTMMPTAFFTYNLLNFLGYSITGNPIQLYSFFSSLAFLPALALAGAGSRTLAGKIVGPATNVGPPTIALTGNSVVQQGKEQSIKIITESRGRSKNMAAIAATVTRPGGKKESLRISKVSEGEYKAVYKPGTSGSYTVHVTATSKEHQAADKSFSFTAQAPPAQHSPPPRPPPAPQSRPPASPVLPPQGRAPPAPSPPPPQANVPSARLNLSLSNWDPRVWVDQEVHGYKIKEYLATGLTGYVLRASFEHGGNEMAIKIPILKPGTGTTALDETMSEATRLLELSEQSKYVVQLRGILVDRLNVQEIVKGDASLYLRSPPAIVMELMKGGAAKKLIEDPSYDSLYYSEKWGGIVMLVGYMIAMALDTIHNAGFVHLDVKPQNILFNVRPPPTGRDVKDQMRNGSLVPKLADLGSAVRIGGKTNQFTSEYAPGEQVLGETAAPQMDVYALGATMYNMLTKTPVNSKKLIDTMNSLTQNPGSGRATNDLKSVWNSFTPDLTRIAKFSSATPLMKKMLAKDPRDRPAAGSVANSLRNLGDMTISP